MRKVVVIVALSLAVLTAGAAVALALASTAARDAAPRPASSVSASASAPVSADDYCYVEAMIYYRVSESALAETLLRTEGADPAARAFAAELARAAEDELEDLREWYVSWADARPLEPADDGPCAGHGADHAQMPGMPTWAQQTALAEAASPEAERLFAEILREQNAGMIALVTLILEGAPHPAVADSAQDVLERARDDLAALDGLEHVLLD